MPLLKVASPQFRSVCILLQDVESWVWMRALNCACASSVPNSLSKMPTSCGKQRQKPGLPNVWQVLCVLSAQRPDLTGKLEVSRSDCSPNAGMEKEIRKNQNL